MEVRVGWNTDFGRSKFDVTADETDLARLLREAEIDTPLDQLTTAEAFALLEAECQRFSAFASMEYNVLSREQAVPQMEAATARRDKRLASVRKRLNGK